MGRRPSVLKLTQEEVCKSMQRLSSNGDFEVWFNLALRERKSTEDEGKSTDNPVIALASFRALKAVDKILGIIAKYSNSIERKVVNPTED